MNELDNMKTIWEYHVFGESGDTWMRWDKIAPAWTLSRETSLTKESGNAPIYAHKGSQNG